MIGNGKIVLDSIVLSKTTFTDIDYLLRDDLINLEPRINLITYHFENKTLTESTDYDIATIDLKFNLIPDVPSHDWFEKNKIKIAEIVYKCFYTKNSRIMSKEIKKDIILQLKELE